MVIHVELTCLKLRHRFGENVLIEIVEIIAVILQIEIVLLKLKADLHVFAGLKNSDVDYTAGLVAEICVLRRAVYIEFAFARIVARDIHKHVFAVFRLKRKCYGGNIAVRALGVFYMAGGVVLSAVHRVDNRGLLERLEYLDSILLAEHCGDRIVHTLKRRFILCLIKGSKRFIDSRGNRHCVGIFVDEHAADLRLLFIKRAHKRNILGHDILYSEDRIEHGSCAEIFRPMRFRRNSVISEKLYRGGIQGRCGIGHAVYTECHIIVCFSVRRLFHAVEAGIVLFKLIHHGRILIDEISESGAL